jgi:L-iditol 2-dehydrogenase
VASRRPCRDMDQSSMMTVPLLSAPSTFSFVSVPRPTAAALAPGQALVRVAAGGICGSDLPYFRGTPLPGYNGAAPATAGYPMHEIAGELVAARSGPDGVEAPPAGSQVVGWATSYDGLADYVVTDVAGIAPYPAGLAAEDAVLIQPLACVLYAVARLGDVSGLDCAVLGLGSIGLLFCHVLRDRGAAHVVGVDRVDRGDVAASFGVDELHWCGSEQWAAGLDPGRRPSLVIEAVGHQVSTLQHALTAVAPSSTVFYFGVNDERFYPLDMDLMLRKNLTLMSGGTLDRQRMLAKAAGYLSRSPELVRLSITHRFPRSQVQRAYELAATPAAGRLKVVITH